MIGLSRGTESSYFHYYTILGIFVFLFLILKVNIKYYIALIFLFLGTWRLEIFNKNYIKIENDYQNIQIEGRITEITLKPRVSYVILETEKDRFYKERQANKAKKSKINIRLKTKRENLNYIKIGDLITIKANIFKIPEENFTFNSNPAFFAKFNQISGYGKILEILGTKNKQNPIDTIKNFRLQKIQYILDNFESHAAGIPIAILFGNTNFIPKHNIENIRHIGIAHILAISGLHITIIMLFSFTIFKKIISLFPYLALRFDGTKIASFFSILFCYFYLFISGVSISAFRSFLMIFLTLSSTILNKRPSSLYFLNISCFIILLNNPLAVKHPSFQLSFIAVLSLICGYKYFFKNDLMDNIGSGFYKKFVSISISEILTVFATTFFEIYHFGQFVFLGFISNFIIIPFVEFLVLPFGFLSFLPGIGDFFMQLCILCSSFIYTFADKFAKIPFCYILTNQANATELSIATFGLLLFFLAKNKINKIGFFCFLVAVGMYFFRINVSEKKYCVIISKEAKNILIRDKGEYFFLKGERFDLNNFAQKFGQKEIKPISFNGDFFLNSDEIVNYFNLNTSNNNVIIADENFDFLSTE